MDSDRYPPASTGMVRLDSYIAGTWMLVDDRGKSVLLQSDYEYAVLARNLGARLADSTSDFHVIERAIAWLDKHDGDEFQWRLVSDYYSLFE